MAYDFNDASSQDIDYGDVTFLDGATKVSGHIWCNIDDVGSDHVLFEKISSGFTTGFILFMDAVGSRSRQFKIFLDGSTNIEGATDSASPTAGWQSVGFTIDYDSATGLNLYIDGALDVNSPDDPTGTASFPNIADTLKVGSHTGGARYMDGQMAEPALWVGRVLTAAEFAALGNGYSADFFPQGRVFYDRLIRGVGDIVSHTTGVVSGATVTAHPPIIYPANPYIITAPAAAAGVTMPRFYHHYQRNTG